MAGMAALSSRAAVCERPLRPLVARRGPTRSGAILIRAALATDTSTPSAASGKGEPLTKYCESTHKTIRRPTR